MALAGYVDQISRSRIEGWVMDTTRPEEAVSVSIFVDGVHRGTCLTTHARDDLELPNGEQITAKCAFHFSIDPPLSPFVTLRIDVVETWSGELLPNGSWTLPRPLHGGGVSGIAPILLTSTGRTGTTLLMSEFARHPDVVVGDHYPYEIKQIAYHAAAFRALAADADWERSTTPETMLAPEMNRIVGSNPYNMSGLFGLGGAPETLRDFYQTTVPSGFAALFQKLIVEFYATVAAAQGKQFAPFFCEKGDIEDAAVQGARLFFDKVKDIVIVRDPRDLLCSAIAFWKLRPEAAMAMLTTTIPRLGRIARHAGADTKVIRYEDLVREPVRTRQALSDFIGLDLLSIPPPDDAHSIPDSHRTSRSPADSISRWREELTPRQIEDCDTMFGLYMREFGYEPSAPARSGRRADGIAAAEGTLAVAAFVENTVAEAEDGTPSRRKLELTFGLGGNGEPSLAGGWSFLERGFVWSCAEESQLRLPPIRDRGDYRIHITAAPLTHGSALPAQRIEVLCDDHVAGTARVSDICVLSIKMPVIAAGSGRPITVTLRFPDAARPCDLFGSDDDRLLGFSLYRVALFHVAPATVAGRRSRRSASNVAAAKKVSAEPPAATDLQLPADGEADSRLLAAQVTEVLRNAFEQPDLPYQPELPLPDISGYDPVRFVTMVLALESKFSVTLREEAVDSLVTMGDVVTLISGEKSRAAARDEARPVRMGTGIPSGIPRMANVEG